jgi:GT2 family glycosyltransferase
MDRMTVKVTVIIPSTGTKDLARAIESVQRQTVPCALAVVCDGPQYKDRVQATYKDAVVLPWNVGGGLPGTRLLGHPMYAAMPFLCKTEYVAFLDEDNWYDPDHVERLLNACESEDRPWAFSLRKIWVDGDYYCVDMCESLGNLRKCFDRDEYLVDTSCFLVRRDVAMTIGPTWMDPHADRPVTAYLIQAFPDPGCSFRATLNYAFQRQNDRGQKPEYFLYGNALVNAQSPREAIDRPHEVLDFVP